MGQIFLMACGRGNLHHDDPNQQQLRRTLQLVCKDWQRFVINDVALWNVLDLRIAPPDHDADARTPVSLPAADSWLRRARSWLRHAAHCPISLDLLISSCAAEEAVELRGRIFNFLSAYRFKALSIVTFIPSMLDLNEFARSLLDVETLSLTASTPLPRPIHLFSHRLPFSSLKSLVLHVDIGNTYENLLSIFPWDQLHKLLLTVTGHLELAADILRRCTSLVDCTISIRQGRMTFITLENITFPCLQHLTIDNDAITSATNAIVQSIVAPNLKSLEIFCLHPSATPISDAVETLARQSGFHKSLRKLVIRNLRGAMNPGNLLEFMPSLRVLKVSGRAVVGEETLSLLANGSLGPRLEKVRFSGCGIRPDALLDMVEDRQINADKEGSGNVVTSFARVSLRFRHSQVTDEHWERVARLRDEYGIYMIMDEGSNGVFSGSDDNEGDEADVVSEDESGDDLE